MPLCFFNKFIYFIYLWLCWVFIAAHGLSLVVASGGYSSLRCTGFSLQWLLLLRSMGSRAQAQQLWLTGSVVVAHGLSSYGSRALKRRLSSCGAQAFLLCSMWDLPPCKAGLGLKPMSPALASRLLTTVPPGKSHSLISLMMFYSLQCTNLTLLFKLLFLNIVLFLSLL